ncbi:unnamed protein product [Larinioides sclopetarius]|uniref:C2H2-type domain-containing protein n=1 Tax=Larinioides sclopetarius TaxID=280406 RepID=A0AAV2AXR3_9ARAC
MGERMAELYISNMKSSHDLDIEKNTEEGNLCDPFVNIVNEKSTDCVTSEEVDANEKSCVCETCGKTVNDRKNLMNHLSANKIEKPFSCDACKICDKTFSQNSVAELHSLSRTKADKDNMNRSLHMIISIALNSCKGDCFLGVAKSRHAEVIATASAFSEAEAYSIR